MAKGGVAQYHLRLCVAPTSGYAGCPTPNSHLPPAVPQSLSSLSLLSDSVEYDAHFSHQPNEKRQQQQRQGQPQSTAAQKFKGRSKKRNNSGDTAGECDKSNCKYTFPVRQEWGKCKEWWQ